MRGVQWGEMGLEHFASMPKVMDELFLQDILKDFNKEQEKFVNEKHNKRKGRHSSENSDH
jgi:hypothetical protein